ncbi:MAG: carbohydrate kinase family protein [Chloroflexi bacterium]|nr:carbohydrate kinase family protein [Chloroflexota bacterium]
MTLLVAGLINIEITLRIEGFPIAYTPVRYPFGGINSSVSGVGYNVAKALTALGDAVDFLSLIGQDQARTMVYEALAAARIPAARVLATLPATAHSVILYDGDGRRQINVDLKDVQRTVYPEDSAREALKACDLAVLCNINFARPLLRLARAAGKLIATDVHAIQHLDDEYNRDYMAAAHILFQSHENLLVSPEEWAQQLFQRYGTEIAVVGLGGAGALLAVRADHFCERLPAVRTRDIINTIGAGDALFSAFIHSYQQTRDPYSALKKAMVFASYKIGEKGAADGFLDAARLDALCAQVYGA